jgi:hypothetical protein
VITSPVVIGATGGSGTRVVARIAQRAGYNLGTYLNEANDALAFRRFHDRWINRFLDAQNRNATLAASEIDQMAQDFRVALAQHTGSAANRRSPWGWKAPRSIYLLSFLHTQFRDLKFIHVLRDGRDMAFSKNQNQLGKHGARLLNWRERWFDPQPVRSILLWSRVNLPAAQLGETELGAKYLLIRFEDLCDEPVETTRRILRFLEVDLDPDSIAKTEIAAPSSIGRWRKHHSGLVSKMTECAEIALRKFGYLETL